MGFFVHTTDDGRNLPMEYLPASALTPRIGLAMKLTAGKLAAVKGAESPAYICMTERDTPCEEGDILQVARIAPDTVWRTTAAADMSDIHVGDMVTISADGLEVTATKGGTALVTAMDGTAAGSAVLVRLVGICPGCEGGDEGESGDENNGEGGDENNGEGE